MIKVNGESAKVNLELWFIYLINCDFVFLINYDTLHYDYALVFVQFWPRCFQVWAVGEFSSSAHHSDCGADLIGKYFEVLEAVTYEFSSITSIQEEMEGMSLSVKVLSVLMSAIAKVRTFHGTVTIVDPKYILQKDDVDDDELAGLF